MKILVTGGAGYIGSVLIRELLAAGHDTVVVDNLRFGGEGLLGVWTQPRFQFLRRDVRFESDRRIALRDVEAVVHLAAIVGDPACKKDPDLAKTINLDATCYLADQARAAGVREFIFVSTCSNYGISDSSQLATEESPLNPVSLYAETKVAAEKYLLANVADGFAPTVLRLATVYGVSPRMRFDLTINEFARDGALGKKLIVYGEHHWRPYVHVQDVAGAVLQVLNSPIPDRKGQIFNVGQTNENYQKITICELLKRFLPGLAVEYVKTGPDPRSYRVSFEKISRSLGYKPERELQQGLEEIVQLVQSGVLSDCTAPRWSNS